MNRQDATDRIIRGLESLHIPYMITGSVASSAYGRPRSTLDVDIVVVLLSALIDDFCREFESEFYLDRDTIKNAVGRRAHFNLIHTAEQVKIDFWVLKDDDFEQEAFSRRVQIDIGGTTADVSSPEDAIISKLKWMKKTGSQRQREDVIGVCAVQGTALDLRYLRAWARRLGLRDELEAVLSEAGLSQE